MNLYDYAPPRPEADLRTMLRRFVMSRSLGLLDRADRRREAIRSREELDAYLAEVRGSAARCYADLPVGSSRPVESRVVSTHDLEGFTVENVLFESWSGWEVNATCYLPAYAPPPWPVIVVPVGHSGKQFESYQFPCQIFARSGYLAVVFDPPGQQSERREGNDHWRDGVRPWLVGESPTRYFIADALRSIDYVATRSDADISRGVAMTGVSGGGKTTMFAASLDDRISVIGPCCCLSPMGEADVAMNLAPCPELYHLHRFADLMDDVDYLLAALPKPVCILAGTGDSLRTPDRVRAVYERLRELYALAGEESRVELFFDDSPHAYTEAMARRFIEFADRHLAPEGRSTDRPDTAETAPRCRLLDYELLRCRPNVHVNMHTLARERGRTLAKERRPSAPAVRRSARKLAHAEDSDGLPECVQSVPYRTVFETQEVVELLLRPEAGIELPGVLIRRSPEAASAGARKAGEPGDASAGTDRAFLFFDEGGRWERLRRGGPLTTLLSGARAVTLLSSDLRGFGDTRPIETATDVYGWTHPMRGITYMTAAIGDHLFGMRIRDGLAWLRWFRSTLPAGARVVVGGAGLGAMTALHVGAIDGGVAGIYVEGAPVSFQSLLEAETPAWEADAYLPEVLLHYDLPDLAGAAGCPVLISNPKWGDGAPAGQAEVRALYAASPAVAVEAGEGGALAERLSAHGLL